MRVIFLTKYDRAGASSRYRFYNYESYFTGFSYEFKPLLSDIYVKKLYNKSNKITLFFLQIISILKRIIYLLNSDKDNFYIIEKELFPNIPYFIEKILLKNKKYALDYDDYVGASYKENRFKKIILKNKLNDLVSSSIFTTVGNKWYFEEFKSDKLIYLPTVIDIEKYEIVYKTKKVTKEKKTKIIWIGSPSTAKYLSIIEKPFVKLSQKYDIQLLVIGGNCPFIHKDVQLIKWDNSSEIENISKGDIGIMPLNNTLWEKGKCGFKLIQYMGVGLAVIGSRSPANNEIVEDCGFICNTEDEWYNKLELLINDKLLRKHLGDKSFNKIKDSYSYQVWGKKYNQIITDAFK